MKRTILLLLTIFSINTLSESKNIKNLLQFDYSSVLVNNNIIGYIGDGQRLYIHFDRISKNKNNPCQYIVNGESRVKTNICKFNGFISIESIVKNEDECSLVKRYVMSGKYKFNEDPTQYGSGFFIGKFTSHFFIINDSVCFDEIDGGSDNYNNNQFEGFWTSYKLRYVKIANWGVGRIPNSDFLDGGADEFRPIKGKMWLGWESYWLMQNESGDKYQLACAEEQRQWWKMNDEIVITWNFRKLNNKFFLDIFRNYELTQSIPLGEFHANYRIVLADYNFDGNRDIIMTSDTSGKSIFFTWSGTSGKYIHDKSLDDIENPIIDLGGKCIVGNVVFDSNKVKYTMYSHCKDKFYLKSILTKSQKNGYKNLVIYDKEGTIVDQKSMLEYSQLPSYWKAFLLYDYIDDNCF